MVTAISERKSNIKTGGATSRRNVITVKSRLSKAVVEINLSFPFLHTDVLQHCCLSVTSLQSTTQIYSWILFFLYVEHCFSIADWLQERGCCLKALEFCSTGRLIIQQSTWGCHLTTGLVVTPSLPWRVHTTVLRERKGDLETSTGTSAGIAINAGCAIKSAYHL